MLPQLLVLLAAIGGSALILGGGAFLWYRVQRLEDRGTGGGGNRRRLQAELEEVRDELAGTREETRRLAERLDFLERLLESGEGSG